MADPIFESLNAINMTLGGLRQGQEDIVKRLEKQNGSISKLYDRTEDAKYALSEHARTCDAKSQITEIEHRIETGDHPGAKGLVEKVNGINISILDIDKGLKELANTIDERDKAHEKQVNKTWHRFILPLANLIGTGMVLLAVHMILKWMGK
jgi:hypothetical protein